MWLRRREFFPQWHWFLGRQPGRVVFLAFWPRTVGDGGSCGARPMPAARAASWGLRGVLRFAMTLRATHHRPHPKCRWHQQAARRIRASADSNDDHQHVCCLRPPARPLAAGNARLATNHRSSSATGQEIGSSPARAPWRRATSMRPRDSEGRAVGPDEDEEGEVRSEGSGPQSWALAAKAPAPASGLRRSPDARHHYRTRKQTYLA